ncbi:hypothetical protein Bca4012_007769 [Brassica carinata]
MWALPINHVYLLSLGQLFRPLLLLVVSLSLCLSALSFVSLCKLFPCLIMYQLTKKNVGHRKCFRITE